MATKIKTHMHMMVTYITNIYMCIYINAESEI